jgi:hypothetical protein
LRIYIGLSASVPASVSEPQRQIAEPSIFFPGTPTQA